MSLGTAPTPALTRSLVGLTILAGLVLVGFLAIGVVRGRQRTAVPQGLQHPDQQGANR